MLSGLLRLSLHYGMRRMQERRLTYWLKLLLKLQTSQIEVACEQAPRLRKKNKKTKRNWSPREKCPSLHSATSVLWYTIILILGHFSRRDQFLFVFPSRGPREQAKKRLRCRYNRGQARGPGQPVQTAGYWRRGRYFPRCNYYQVAVLIPEECMLKRKCLKLGYQ